jgi:hypothetical protein
MRWLDRFDPRGRTYAVTTGPVSGDIVRLKSLGDVIAEYRSHPEAKSVGLDGRPCGRETIGLLRRRPVRAANFVYIGKEANELDDVEEGLVHDLGEVVTEYGTLDDPWLTNVLPVLRAMPLEVVRQCSGLARSTIQRYRTRGPKRMHPRREHETTLTTCAAAWATEQLWAMGEVAPADEYAALRRWHADDTTTGGFQLDERGATRAGIR